MIVSWNWITLNVDCGLEMPHDLTVGFCGRMSRKGKAVDLKSPNGGMKPNSSRAEQPGSENLIFLPKFPSDEPLYVGYLWTFMLEV